MEKIPSKQRRTDYFDFGHGLTLVNILHKTEDGKPDRIETYLGVEGNAFVVVSSARDLSAPGVIFSYSEYVRILRMNQSKLLDIFKQKYTSNLIADGRAYTVDQYLKLH